MFKPSFILATVAAQMGCFDTMNGQEILNCVCDSSCLTCVEGEPPSPEDCLSCADGFSLDKQGISDTGTCIMKDFDDFFGDESASSAHNGLKMTVTGLIAAAIMANL